MKVLKPGREQSGWAEQQQCTGDGNGGGGCGATLLVEFADLYTTQSSARDEVTSCVTFSCACCKVMTDISDYRGPRIERKTP